MPSYIARFPARESDALRFAELLGEDEAIAANAAACSEIADGKWEVTLYFTDKPNAARLQKLVESSLGLTKGKLKLRVDTLPDEDWVAKSLAGLQPVEAGRFLVHGSHDRDRPLPNHIAIEIEASRAFGTGHHGTTRGCLVLLGRLARRHRFRHPLDLGTGSGVLAIAMARLWRVPVLATDIDPVATRVAAENAELNGVAGLVDTITAPGFRHQRVHQAAPYDLIVANILAGPLASLAPDFARHIAAEGQVVLSGILESQGDRVLAAFRTHGFVLADIHREAGWVSFRLDRRPAKQKRRSLAAPPS